MDLNNEYGTLRIQESLLRLLKEFDAFCVKNAIHYSLSSGSLLGAVRHGGFIPWDDDVDVMISRVDYEKFLSIINNAELIEVERLPGNAFWVDRVRFKENDKEFVYPPTIDLFVLDNCPENKLLRSLKVYTIYLLQGMMKNRLILVKGRGLMNLCSIVAFSIGRLIPGRIKYQWYCKVSQWGNRRSSSFLGSYHDQYIGVPIVYDKVALSEYERIPFEDTMVSVFKGRDSYLRKVYGDNFMIPPEKENRNPTHT